MGQFKSAKEVITGTSVVAQPTPQLVKANGGGVLKTKLLNSLLLGQPQQAGKIAAASGRSSIANARSTDPMMQKKAALLSSQQQVLQKQLQGATAKGGAKSAVSVVGRKCLEHALASQTVKIEYCPSKASFDGTGSIADENNHLLQSHASSSAAIKQKGILKVPGAPSKPRFAKHVTFGSGEADEQVAIHFYEQTPVDMPWNGPRPSKRLGYGHKEQAGLHLKTGGYHGRSQEHALSYRLM